MKYTTVIFDLDGTLLDSQAGIARSMNKALAQYGIEESEQVICGLIGPPLSKTILTRYSLTPERRDEIMAVFREFQFGEGLLACRIYDGVPEMLTRLRESGLRLAIATNKPGDLFAAQLEHYPIGHFFDAIETNNPEQTRGSKSDFVRWAMQGCGSDPAHTLMVGDRLGDIAGGAENGTDTLGVLYGYGSREELESCSPTYFAESPAQVADIVLES